MVQLVLRLSSDPKEWKIIELQGQLETRDSVPLNSIHIGDLYFDSKGTASLIVGHHLLSGKLVELEKPFAVLQKKKTIVRDNDNWSVDPMEVDSTAHVDSGAMCGTCEYEVVAFIKQKIIFKDRPKPIVQKSSVRT